MFHIENFKSSLLQRKKERKKLKEREIEKKRKIEKKTTNCKKGRI